MDMRAAVIPYPAAAPCGRGGGSGLGAAANNILLSMYGGMIGGIFGTFTYMPANGQWLLIAGVATAGVTLTIMFFLSTSASQSSGPSPSSPG